MEDKKSQNSPTPRRGVLINIETEITAGALTMASDASSDKDSATDPLDPRGGSVAGNVPPPPVKGVENHFELEPLVQTGSKDGHVPPKT